MHVGAVASQMLEFVQRSDRTRERTGRSHKYVIMAIGVAAILLVGALAYAWVPMIAQSAPASTREKLSLIRLRHELSSRGPRFAWFNAPVGVIQGRQNWYAVRARLRVILKRHITAGSAADIFVLTDGHTDFMVHIVAARVNGLPALRWSSDDLFAGQTGGVIVGNAARLNGQNYLEAQGIHSGSNSLSILLRQGAGGPVSVAKLLTGSSVSGGVGPPPRLSLAIWTREPSVKAGQLIHIHYELRSSGLPAREVALWSTWSGSGIVPLDAPSRFLGWVARRPGK